MLSSIVGTNPRQSLSQLLNFALVLSSAFMIWKGLTVVTGSPSPIVVVLSGSMEPAFQRGDLLFLWNRAPRAEVGEIVVYNVRGKDIPIVHRVVRSFSAGQGKGEEKGLPQETTEKEIGGPSLLGHSIQANVEPHYLLTKGDNNMLDDTKLYADGQPHLDRKADLIGSVRWYVPAVGYVTILLSEHPWLKAVLLGSMGLLTLLQQDT